MEIGGVEVQVAKDALFLAWVLGVAVYDGAMESSFRHPPHQQLLKRQTVIGETLKHRR